MIIDCGLLAMSTVLAFIPSAIGAVPAENLSQLQAAQALARQGRSAEARAAYEQILAAPETPGHLRWEAQECLREIQAQQSGLPVGDPAASRTQFPPRPQPGLV